MPNLNNQDSIGNTYFNYVSPSIGSSVNNCTDSSFVINYMAPFFTTAYGAAGGTWNIYNSSIKLRFPASGIETKSGVINNYGNGNDYANVRVQINYSGSYRNASIYTNNANNNSATNWDIGGNTPSNYPINHSCFIVANNYSYCEVIFNNTLTTMYCWRYLGWLKDPIFTSSSNYPRGFVALNSWSGQYLRNELEEQTTKITISSASNSITNPSLSCIVANPSADSGRVKVRNATADSNGNNICAGKLYNVITVSSSIPIGSIIANNGDNDGSNNNKYLVFTNWGSQRLAIRVWTEGYS